MDLSLPGSKRTRGNSSVAVLIVLALGLGVAIFIGLKIGQSDFKTAYLAALAVMAFPALLFLGDKYWVFLPAALVVNLPAVPIVAGRSVSFAELWIAFAAGAFLLRVPFMGGRLAVYRREFVPVFLYLGWTILVWKLNGAGLAILGASTFGGRSYLKIGLAVIAFVILVNQRPDERQCGWIIFSLIAAAVVSTVWNVYSYLYSPNLMNLATSSFYTWHQFLAWIPTYLLAYIFSRYSPQDLVARFQLGWLGLILICYGLLAFSGKRAALGVCVLFPMISAMVRRQYAAVVVGVTAMLMVVCFLVFGHGRMFELPQTVQRVLWVFPGNWDYSVRINTSGTFRQTLNKLAMAQIQRYPVIGRGFGFTSQDALRAVDMDPVMISRIVNEGDHLGAYIMAASSEWHSTWLGISATLGIPAAIVFALIWFQLVKNSVWVYRNSERGSSMQILSMIILLLVCSSILRSMTSGHAASSIMGACWQLGIILAMRYSILDARVRQESTEEVEASGRGRPRFPIRPDGNRPGMPPAPQMGRTIT